MRRLERLDVREPVRAELLARPLADGEQSLGRRFLAGVRVEHEGVRVAEHNRAVEPAEERDDLGGLGAALDRVAEADDLIDRSALEVLQHRPERDRVAVHVGDEGGRIARGYAIAIFCSLSWWPSFP